MLPVVLGSVLILSAAFALVVTGLVAWRRPLFEASGLGGLLGGGVLLAYGDGVMSFAAALADKEVGRAIGYAGIGVAVMGFAILATRLSAGAVGGLPRRLALILVLPSLLALGVASNGLHGLFFSITGFEIGGVVARVKVQWAPAMWLYALVLGTYLAVAMAILWMRDAGAVNHDRSVVVAMTWAGGLCAAVALSNLVLGDWLVGIDPLPFVVLGAGLAVVREAVRCGGELHRLARDHLMDCLPDGVVIVDRDGVVVDHNEEALQLLMMTGPIRGRSVAALLGAIPRVSARFSIDTPAEIELDGRVVEINSRRITRQDGRAAGLILQFHDATRARRAEQALAAALAREARLGALSRVLSVTRPIEELPAVALPVIGELLEARRCAMHLVFSGWELGVAWTPEDGIVPSDDSGLLAAAGDEGGVTLVLDARGIAVGTLRCERPQPFGANDEALVEAARWMLANAISNILLVRDLELAARTDALTGLDNRASFVADGDREFALAIRHQRSLCVAVCDLDLFKSVNDRHGHAAGDVVLAEAARRIAGAVRTTDIVCRWGGEEFAVLMPESDLVAGGIVAERIRRAVSAQPIAFERSALTVTVSIGVAALNTGDQQLSSLTKRADRGLYAAKRAGRNRVVLDHSADGS